MVVVPQERDKKGLSPIQCGKASYAKCSGNKAKCIKISTDVINLFPSLNICSHALVQVLSFCACDSSWKGTNAVAK